MAFNLKLEMWLKKIESWYTFISEEKGTQGVQKKSFWLKILFQKKSLL